MIVSISESSVEADVVVAKVDVVVFEADAVVFEADAVVAKVDAVADDAVVGVVPKNDIGAAKAEVDTAGVAGSGNTSSYCESEGQKFCDD